MKSSKDPPLPLYHHSPPSTSFPGPGPGPLDSIRRKIPRINTNLRVTTTTGNGNLNHGLNPGINPEGSQDGPRGRSHDNPAGKPAHYGKNGGIKREVLLLRIFLSLIVMMTSVTLLLYTWAPGYAPLSLYSADVNSLSSLDTLGRPSVPPGPKIPGPTAGVLSSLSFSSFQSPAVNDALLDLPPAQRLSVLECSHLGRSCSVKNLYVLSSALHAYVGPDASVERLHDLNLYTGFGSGTPVIRVYVIGEAGEEPPPPVIEDKAPGSRTPLIIHLFVHRALPPQRASLSQFFKMRAFTQPVVLCSVLWENLFRTMYAGVGALNSLMHHGLYFPGRHRFILVDPARPSKFLGILQTLTPFELKWFEEMEDGLYKAAVLGISRFGAVEEIMVEDFVEYGHYLRQNAFRYFSQQVRAHVLKITEAEAARANDWSVAPAASPAGKSRRVPVVTYVSRTGVRTILNEKEMLQRLQELPVQINAYKFEELTLEKQIEIAHRTDIFIALHGAAMAQTIFLREGSYVLELFPFAFRKVIYQNIAKITGLRYMSWQNPDIAKTVFRWDLLEGRQVTDMPKERVVNLPIDWYNMDSKNYWRNQDTVVDVEEIYSLVKFMVFHAADPEGLKFLMNAPWEQSNNQLVEFSSACALGLILDRTVVLPKIGYRNPLPDDAFVTGGEEGYSDEVEEENNVNIPLSFNKDFDRSPATVPFFSPLNYTWNPFEKYFSPRPLLDLPCATISSENFVSLNAGRSLGKLRYHPLGDATNATQLTEYYGNVSHFVFDTVEVDPNAYTHQSLEEVRALHSANTDRVLALGALFWYFDFGIKPTYPLDRVYNHLDHPVYRKIQEALRFNPFLEDLASRSLVKLPQNFVALHLRRGDYLAKCNAIQLERPELFDRCYQTNTYVKNFLDTLGPESVVFVATNPETDRDNLRKVVGDQHRLSFLEDVLAPFLNPWASYTLDPVERAIVEQIICTQAGLFVGNLYSSFSKTVIEHRTLQGKTETRVF